MFKINGMSEEQLRHEVSLVRCDVCSHKWVAVRPEGLLWLECPNCANMVGFENLNEMTKDLEVLKADVKKLMLKDYTKTEVTKLDEFIEDVIIATMLVNKLPVHVVVGQTEQCCEPISDGFYLGTSCPKCNKLFRQNFK